MSDRDSVRNDDGRRSADEEVQSEASSYASPKDHISVSSGASDAPLASRLTTEHDPPSLERLKPTESPENEDVLSDPEETEVSPSTSLEAAEEAANGIRLRQLEQETEDLEEPSLTEELAYAHRPKESTPTRRSLSQAAKELTTEGVPKGDKKLARCLSGLTAEVLGDEGRLNSPLDDDEWRRREKHFFILSSAGKPIYSRYGDEGALCGMMAILEAIVSVVHSKGEKIQSVVDGPVKMVFNAKGPVVLVCVSRKTESIKWILKQLDYLYYHVLCLATGALLKVLEQNPGHDIRNLLKGSAPLTGCLIKEFGLNPGLFLESFFPVRLLKGIRHNATTALVEASKICQARASFLLFDGQVVCMTQEGGSQQMEVMDLLLLLNFVLTNELFRSQSAAEFNAPVCMPHLHETAFLHAYIYFIEKDPDLVVVLLMTQPDTFHVASEARKRMERRLREVGVVHSLRSRKTGRQIYDKGQLLMEELPLAAGGGRRDLSAVQTFLFRRRSASCPQLVLCQPSAAMHSDAAWQDITATLASIHCDLPGDKKATTQKIYWHMDSCRSILYECSSDWDLYLVCDPLTMKEHASNIGRQIVRFILSDQVKEELFMSSTDRMKMPHNL